MSGLEISTSFHYFLNLFNLIAKLKSSPIMLTGSAHSWSSLEWTPRTTHMRVNYARASEWTEWQQARCLEPSFSNHDDSVDSVHQSRGLFWSVRMCFGLPDWMYLNENPTVAEWVVVVKRSSNWVSLSLSLDVEVISSVKSNCWSDLPPYRTPTEETSVYHLDLSFLRF